MNDPRTLARARLQIQIIDQAKTASSVHFHWTYAQGYFMALFDEQLIDGATKQALDLATDAARNAWGRPLVTLDESCTEDPHP